MGIDLLIGKIKELGCPCVAGLDPKLEMIPEFIKKEALEKAENPFDAAGEALFEFNKRLIDDLYDIMPAIKPQSAYYELYGWQGVRALHRTISYAKERGMVVILDVKRNDIGTTAQAYSSAYLGQSNLFGEKLRPFTADAITVNGYLGTDGIKPFVEDCKSSSKMIFVLVKTSNPSSGELQDRICGEKTVYQMMGELCEKWGTDTIGKYGYSAVGAVVGATYPEQLKELRASMPHTFFLVPGYGAQGGGASDVLGAFDQNGIGGIVNSSRAILTAYKKEGCDEKEFSKAARREAIRMRDEIMNAIKNG